MLKTSHAYLARNSGISGGSLVLKGTRIRVIDIALEYEYLGKSPDEIVRAHPHLSLAQVHDAISYYYENQRNLDAEILKRREEMKRMAGKAVSRLRG